jgi:formylglycine-generating enzyme required for sulfatase activity
VCALKISRAELFTREGPALDGARIAAPGAADASTPRVVKGGTWGAPARYCRAADRTRHLPTDRNEGLVFRLGYRPRAE